MNRRACILSTIGAVLPSQSKRVLSISVPPPGNVAFAVGGTLANLISNHIPNVVANAEVNPGASDVLRLLHAGRLSMGFTNADIVYDAHAGRLRGLLAKVPVRCLAVCWINTLHIVTVPETRIATLQDLKGKNISVGAPASATEMLSLRVLEAAGIQPGKDLPRPHRLTVTENAAALKNRKIDAFFNVSGLPTPGIMDLASTPGVTLLFLPSRHLLGTLRERHGPVYVSHEIPKGTYQGLAGPVATLGSLTMLVTHERMEEKLAYDFTRIMHERTPEFVLAHQAARDITAGNTAKNSPVPLHSGAERYFRERKLL